MPNSENIAALEALEAAYNTGKGKPLDADGRELLDPRPVAPPVGYQKQPSMVEHIRNMVRSELLARAVTDEGLETFEEAEDFDVGDDYDPTSPYEAVFEPPAPPDPKPPENPPGASSEAPVIAPAEPKPIPAAGSKTPTPPAAEKT